MTNKRIALDVKKIKEVYRDRMLQLSFIVSGWSKEPSGQRHGCVIALDGKWIVGTGFNGKDRFHIGSQKCPCIQCEGPVIHAEENVMINIKETLGWHDLVGKNAVAYVSKKPCEPCMALLQGAGIEMVCWLQDLSSADSTWVRP